MKRLFKILIYIFIIFLVIYNVVLIIQKLKNPNKIPNFLGYKNFIILSGSMEDELNIGDIIFIKEKTEINENDIISFNENGATVTHRVVEIIREDDNLLYKTKGDANATIDTRLVSKNEVEGVYCFKIPKIGILVLFLQTKVGILLFLILLFIIYIFLNKPIFRKRAKGRHSNDE